MSDTPTDPDVETGLAPGDHPDERSPDVETAGGGAGDDGERRVDPESPGETIDDVDVAEPNEPG